MEKLTQGMQSIEVQRRTLDSASKEEGAKSPVNINLVQHPSGDNFFSESARTEQTPLSGYNISGTSPVQGAKSVQQVANALSFSLFQKDKKNSISSPLSMALSLAILERGAKGEAKTSLRQLLAESGSDSRSPIKNLLMLAKEIGHSGIVKMTSGFFISKLAGNVNKEYFERIDQIFQAMRQSADYRWKLSTDCDLSTDQFKNDINKIVRNDTDNKIQEILSKTLSESPKSLILNAVALKAHWVNKLDVRTINFENGAGETSAVSAVKYNEPRATDVYSNGIKWQLAWCQFANKNYGVLLGMPDKGQHLKAFEDLSFLANAIDTLGRDTWLDAGCAIFPKLKLESDWDMRSIMDRSGQCNAVFSDNADFSGIAQGLSISEIKQKAVLELDEDGFEDAVAITDETHAFIIETYKKIFNSPFKIWVLHRPTGTILFEGNFTEQTE